MNRVLSVLALSASLGLCACAHSGAPKSNQTAREPLPPIFNSYAQFRSPVGDRCLKAGPDGACVLFKPAIVELVTRPELFHAKQVQVVGFVSLEFERNIICPSEKSDTSECLWLDLEGMLDPGFAKGRAIVQATFDGENRGNLGGYPGALVSITRFERWRW